MRKILIKEILDKMLNDYHNGMGLVELSNKYGFQEQTIQKHFRTLGLTITKSNAKKFSGEELANIIDDYQKGIKPFELAKKYNRNSGTIIEKLKSIGLYKNSNHHYTKDDIDFLKKYYPIGDWDSIYQRFPNTTKQSIQTKMSKLNIHLDSHYWTKEDKDILRHKYPYMFGHIKELVELFDNKYTYKAIMSKARKMGLKTREFWSKEELNILKTKYEQSTLDELIVYLPNRSRSSIVMKALSLGLSNKVTIETRFSKSEKDFVLNNYEYMTDKEIGEVLGRSTTAINNYRFRNGLIKIYEKSSYNDLSEYIRRNNLDWKTQSIKSCGYKCVLTGNRFDDIHHIYGLNLILNDTLNELDIEVKESMDMYTDKELRDILDIFRIKQSEHPLGVCLSKNVHTLFHSKYGYGYNTQEQWDEFSKNFKEGKYNENLNVF